VRRRDIKAIIALAFHCGVANGLGRVQQGVGRPEKFVVVDILAASAVQMKIIEICLRLLAGDAPRL
jgi:hypothetical protein